MPGFWEPRRREGRGHGVTAGATSYELDLEVRHVLAADLGHTYAALAITDLLGGMCAPERESLDLEQGPCSVIDHVLGRAGVIADGALQRGAQGFAGDIGHVPLMNSDRPCPCGNTGCVSLTGSLPGPAASLREAGREVESDADVVDLVAHGDPEAQRLLRQAGRDVGEVMVAAVGLLNPSRLVIGGP